MQVFVDGLHEYLRRAFAPVGARLKSLEARIAVLEAEAGAREYKGVWSADAPYVRHNAVTYDGSVWICRAESTRQRPADGNDWQLAVRKGRDAK